MKDGEEYNSPERKGKEKTMSDERKKTTIFPFFSWKTRKYCGMFRSKILKWAKLTSKST